jgi:TetR/AcrR family transcriptional repressor of nem operon
MGASRRPGTAERILDTAERLVQVRGFNAFSYADVSAALGIQKASLHHHFATKADLGLALVARYRRRFGAELARIEAAERSAAARLERYASLYRAVLRRKRMCLCGMLATDAATLPRRMRESVVEFFAENEAWLARVLHAGRETAELEFDGAASPLAAFVVSSFEGALLVARLRGGARYFDRVVRQTLIELRPRRAVPRRQS